MVLRLYPTLIEPSMAWPDEIFQTVEPAHRLVYGSGLVPWEFPARCSILVAPRHYCGPDGAFALVGRRSLLFAYIGIFIAPWRSHQSFASFCGVAQRWAPTPRLLVRWSSQWPPHLCSSALVCWLETYRSVLDRRRWRYGGSKSVKQRRRSGLIASLTRFK